MRSVAAVLAATLFFGDAAVAMPLADVQSAVQKIVKSPPLATSKNGIYIYSLSKDRVVFAKNEDQLFSPASNTKIVTSAAALHVLKPDYHFHTEILADAAPKGGIVSGNLYVRGFGDPALVSERMWYIANELWHAGVRQVTGDIVGDDTFFDDDHKEAGWDEDTSDQAYQAMVGGLSANYGTLTVRVLPAETDKQPATVVLDPPVLFAQLDAQVETVVGKRTKISIEVTPSPPARDTVKVRGKINIDDGPHGYWRKVDYPTEFATSAIASFIRKAGITIGGSERRGKTPEGAIQLVGVESPRLSEIVDDLMKTSNNFVAEQIVKTLGAEVYGAPGSWDKGLRVLRDYLQTIGIQPGTYQLKNGSGLGDVNRVTAKELVTVLRAAWLDAPSAAEFMSSLGVAGSTGTLRHRMVGTAAAYRLRGKTGSLANACTLSGYVRTMGNELLAFSILVNSFRSMHAVHEAQDQIGEVLAELDGEQSAL